ncbi:hypothetical protein, partial [Stenotrophomonas maltophilia]|uniref:hypothetical protein n=1 Tax=Stenotrophomonas maltophilia TaxID=40324 RepID=UPI001FA7A9A2
QVGLDSNSPCYSKPGGRRLARNLRIGTLLPSNQASLGRRENCRIKPVRGGLSPFFLKKLKYRAVVDDEKSSNSIEYTI